MVPVTRTALDSDAADPSRRARSARSLRMTAPGGGGRGGRMRRKGSVVSSSPFPGASEPVILSAAGAKDLLWRAAARRIVRLAALGLVVALLPFLVLVKVAVFLYGREGWSTVLALAGGTARSEEHTSELQSHHDLVCSLLLEKKKKKKK